MDFLVDPQQGMARDTVICECYGEGATKCVINCPSNCNSKCTTNCSAHCSGDCIGYCKNVTISPYTV